ncbi:hypothetical protein N7466_010678 [Penicillium verhagenii]|uniref:uncharacterized protein n=1 Tax=Penicillium verhagenii TaxID=1562060 RepID=UPI002545AA13|nr:uncharacterized protein N7466_010678 [Penicillium verhagenii]KAJ5917124.1 hypothetical protein N7466_010678 [Penicillium verhagenii]
MNAAVVTDGAIQLARDLVQVVVEDYASNGIPSESLQQLIFNACSISRGIVPTPSAEIGLPYNKDMADVAELCYFPTLVLLTSFADVLRQNELPVFKKGYFGRYDPSATREKMSVGQKFHEDKIILLQLLPEFCIFGYKSQMPALDVITTGLAEFCKTKKITPWLCFASQILLDVHHIMRHSQVSALDDLRMSGLRIQRTVAEYLKISKSHPQPKFWPKEGDEEIKDLHSTVESCIIEDPIYAIKVDVLPRGHVPEKHVLFSQHTILCGVNMFHLNMRMQSVGQRLITQWYDVQQLAFLYNLFRQAPMHAHLSWPDMETFIKIHGESHIFIGSRPRNASESLNRLELATGISSATKFARDSRNRSAFHRPNGKNSRILEPTTTVANLFRGQYVAGCRKEDEGIENIDKVLDALSKEAGLEATSKEAQLRNPQKILQRKWDQTHHIGTIQLLALIKNKLFEEEPVILFNYFGMHKRSLELLREIKAKEHQKFVQYFTPSYMPDESFISNIVLLVHHVAKGSAQNAKDMGITPRAPGAQIISRIVVSCGDVMQVYLRKNGDVACKELKIFCKNKTPIQEIAEDDGDRSKQFMSWVNFEDVLGPKAMASLMTGVPVS